MANFGVDGLEARLKKVGKTGFKSSGSIDRPKFRLKPGQLDVEAGLEEINRVIDRTIQRVAEDLEFKLDAAMASSLWGEMGDIIDSGDLRDSLQVTVEGNSIQISYDSPYANLVHYGGYIAPYGNKSIEKVYIPARPWVEAVFVGNGPVDSINVPEIFDQEKG